VATPRDRSLLKWRLDGRRTITLAGKTDDNHVKDRKMNGYKPSTPRSALGLIAIAMSAITIGAMVGLPAKLDSVNAEPFMLAAAKAATNAPIEAAVDPDCDDVPAVVDRDVHAGRTILGAQEFARGVTN
jgi:hypothetical protein